MSYGPSFPDFLSAQRRMADKILRGTKPADIRPSGPPSFDLVINLIAAKALGLGCRRWLRARRKVIE